MNMIFKRDSCLLNFALKLLKPRIHNVVQSRHVSSETTSDLLISEHNGVREIVMNDPKTRNALSVSMMQQLITAINRNKDDSNLRCITLSSSNPSVFSSGHNLKHMDINTVGKESVQKIFDTCSTLMFSIMNHPVPVVAIVDGIAAAAGCQLVATCDVALCTDNSKFSTPGAHHGIFCSTPSVALVRKIPIGLAKSMVITGLPISAELALTSGLVAKVVKSRKDLEEEKNVVVESILESSRSVIAMGKQFFYKQVDMSVQEAYRLGGDTMVQNLCMQDGAEGMKAFTEKRKPVWCHTNVPFPTQK